MAEESLPTAVGVLVCVAWLVIPWLGQFIGMGED